MPDLNDLETRCPKVTILLPGDVREEVLGGNHPDVAISLNNLAVLLSNTGRIEEAEPLLRRALQIRESNYGPEHPLTAEIVSNLKALLEIRGHGDKGGTEKETPPSS